MGELGTSTQSTSCFGIFLLDFFFRDWSLRTGPPPPPERNSTIPLFTAVLITPKGAEPPGRSNRCAGSYLSIRDRLGQTFLSLVGPVAN